MKALNLTENHNFIERMKAPNLTEIAAFIEFMKAPNLMEYIYIIHRIHEGSEFDCMKAHPIWLFKDHEGSHYGKI